MANDQELERGSEGLEPKESHPIPFGWGVLFWGLVAFGAYYLWAYTPSLGGWSQEGELAAAAASSTAGVNVVAAVLFTAVAAAFAIGIMVAFARRKR